MHLSDTQCERFFRLFYSLLNYVNDEFNVLGEPFQPFEDDLGPEQIVELNRYIFSEEGGSAISRYVSANPDNLSGADLAQVATWSEVLPGLFVVLEHTAAYSVFFSDGCAFNVLGLSEDISHIITGELPATIETVLLPFDKYIVYGVSILQHSVSMGPGAMEIFHDEYTKFPGEGRLVTSSEGFMFESPRVKQRRARFKAEQSQLRCEPRKRRAETNHAKACTSVLSQD